MAHEDEAEGFGRFLDISRGRCLAVDTYDVRSAVKKIIAMGRKPAGIRLDSGDLAKDSRWVRRELDRAGWNDVKIFASGDLDEYKIEELLAEGAAIDAFGVGTALGTPGDAPHLSLIYKLVEVERGGKIHEAAKFSPPKSPILAASKCFVIPMPLGKSRATGLLSTASPQTAASRCSFRDAGGRRVNPPESVDALRDRCPASLHRLPARYRQVNRQATYPVRYSKQLDKMLEKVRRRVNRLALK